MNLIILNQDDFISSNKVVLKERRLQHISNVHKANVGDTLKVGLLNGNIGLGTIETFNTHSLEMNVELNSAPPAPLDLTLICALPRPKVLKRVIQSITTLGIKKIYFINCWKVEKSYWGSPVLSEESLQEHVILGLEQAKDTIMPDIQLKKLFKPFVEDELPEIVKDTYPILAHPGQKQNIPQHTNQALSLAIGPEGGFTQYEVEKLLEAGFQQTSFGNRILKVEVAIPYILGALSAF